MGDKIREETDENKYDPTVMNAVHLLKYKSKQGCAPQSYEQKINETYLNYCYSNEHCNGNHKCFTQ